MTYVLIGLAFIWLTSFVIVVAVMSAAQVSRRIAMVLYGNPVQPPNLRLISGGADAAAEQPRLAA